MAHRRRDGGARDGRRGVRDRAPHARRVVIGRAAIAALLALVVALLPAVALADQPQPEPAAEVPPPVAAAAVAIVDADSGALLYGVDAHGRRAQASLTKMTTALVA